MCGHIIHNASRTCSIATHELEEGEAVLLLKLVHTYYAGPFPCIHTPVNRDIAGPMGGHHTID